MIEQAKFASSLRARKKQVQALKALTEEELVSINEGLFQKNKT